MTTEAYDALVYDLDGTLVHLDVDWDAVRRDAAAVLRARGHDVEGVDLWGLLTLAAETGHRERLEERIGEHEREGARRSRRLAPDDSLPHEVPVGVCSLNSEAAARIALEVHGLDGHVGSVVGRDSLDTWKPEPEPLLATVDALGADPERTLFVGDTPRDEETARAAGTDYVDVEEWDWEA